MASHHPIRKTVAPPAPVIPDKLYFRIGDVARLCEVPAYVLRFWETEFANLKPNKGGTGQRLYRKKDVETALRIKHLLYDLGYTIPGARQVFKAEAAPGSAVPIAAPPLHVAAEPAAPIAIAPPQSSPAPGQSSPVIERRIAALREELLALQAQLGGPIAAQSTPLRPQLVPTSKPRSEPEKNIDPRLTVLPGQQALFPAD